MTDHEHSAGDDPGGGGGGGDDGFGTEEPTRVESQLGIVRAEARLWADICDPLDAAALALERIEDALARVSPARRRQFLYALVMKLGRMGEVFHDLRRDYQALHRIEEQRERKDNQP